MTAGRVLRSGLRKIGLILALAAVPSGARMPGGQTPAFPGAEGFGRFTAGGAGRKRDRGDVA
jgi:hypothetical protein